MSLNTTFPGDLHLHLFCVSVMTISPQRWGGRHYRDSFWRLYRNGDDGVALQTQHATYPLAKGHLYIVPAGVSFLSQCSHDIEHFYIHFDVLGLPTVVLRQLFHQPICLPSELVLDQALLEVAYKQVPLDVRGQCRIKAILYEGLAYHLANLPVEQLEQSWHLAQSLQPVQPALDYIEAHLGEHLENAELARCCHMQKDYFIRRFRAGVGQTPVQYILERRIAIATQRLLFTDQSINEIALATGFGNRYYFSRVFKQHTGIAPVAYRSHILIS